MTDTFKTWGDVIREFENEVLPRIESLVIDYRPCAEPYTDFFVPNGLLVYLKDDSKIIYIPSTKKKRD